MKWILGAVMFAAMLVVSGGSEAQATDGVLRIQRFNGGQQFIGRDRFGRPVFVQRSDRQFSRGRVFLRQRPVFLGSRRGFSRFNSGPVFIDDGFRGFGRRNNFSLFNLQF